MRRGTKVFLLLGCALVLALDGPRTLAVLARGWNGPYGPAPRVAEVACAALEIARPGVIGVLGGR